MKASAKIRMAAQRMAARSNFIRLRLIRAKAIASALGSDIRNASYVFMMPTDHPRLLRLFDVAVGAPPQSRSTFRLFDEGDLTSAPLAGGFARKRISVHAAPVAPSVIGRFVEAHNRKAEDWPTMT